MKRCPTCNKTFTDRNLSFCIDDGTPLVPIEPSDDEVTRVSPASGSVRSSADIPTVLAYQAPKPYLPPGMPPNQPKRKAWPWVVGILGLLLLLLIGAGIAAAIFIPKMIREAANENNSNANANVNRNRGNSNANVAKSTKPEEQTNDNANDNANVAESESAPTDEQQVLSQLTDLEHEWTAANINADKKTLERILADDYVGDDANGKPQGKAEYLKTIQRDTSIQKWDFEDLKVDLTGDRASLSGVIRLQVNDKPVALSFTDKFVWRDGRWQAVGSKVSPLKE